MRKYCKEMQNRRWQDKLHQSTPNGKCHFKFQFLWNLSPRSLKPVLVLLAQILGPFGQTWVFHKFGWVFHKFTENGEFYKVWFHTIRGKNRDARSWIYTTHLLGPGMLDKRLDILPQTLEKRGIWRLECNTKSHLYKDIGQRGRCPNIGEGRCCPMCSRDAWHTPAQIARQPGKLTWQWQFWNQQDRTSILNSICTMHLCILT